MHTIDRNVLSQNTSRIRWSFLIPVDAFDNNASVKYR